MTSVAVRTCVVALVIACATVAAMPTHAAPRHFRAPRGYTVAGRQRLGSDLRHLVLQASDGRSQRIHVARVGADAHVRLQPVPSQGNLSGRGPRLERTSTLCRRVDCLLAINGDFFAQGEPVGGVLLGGILIQPPSRRPQLLIDTDRRLTTGRLALRGRLVATDLSALAVDRVDDIRRLDEIVVYTPRFGRRTHTFGGAELVARVVSPAGPLRAGQTSLVRLVRSRGRKGNAAIPPGGVVLSGSGAGADALRSLWVKARDGEISPDVLLRVESNGDTWNSIGGRPVLVRAGRVVPQAASSFARGRHPRTIIGRTRTGETLLVTIDGRRPGAAGMSLRDAARLMQRMGAVDAINLDGGGSTTFVVKGRVVNRPSDGRERRVAVALAVVRNSRVPAGPAVPQLGGIALPTPTPSPTTSVGSPAPGEIGSRIVGGAAPRERDRRAPMAAAVLAAGGLMLVLARRLRRRARLNP